MKLERTKNAKRNIIFGILLKLYQIIVPFIMRTLLVRYLGIEYLGVNSLFTSILSVLNIAELGVGSALVFSMYKPIAEDDVKAICALMRLYRIYYRAIGLIILVVGLMLTPALPFLVKGNLPSELNLYILYFLNLGATVLSYWLFAYKNSILTAHQRTDVSSKIGLIVNTLLYAIQIGIIVIWGNYYVYIILSLVAQAAINLLTAIVSDKLYPKYKPAGTLDKKTIKTINRRVRDLFTAKLGGTILSSADTVVISAFLGLSALAIYNNYFYIVASIIGFISIGYSALLAGIGNSLILEDKEKNYGDFNTIMYISMGITCIVCTCFLNLFQPFMKLWMGEKYLLSFGVVVCMCIYFVVFEINTVLNLYKDAAGIWHQDRFRPLIVSIANLCLNLASVKWLGLYGVLLSTIVTITFIGIPWVTSNLYKSIFDNKKIIPMIKKILYYLILTFVCCLVTYYACKYLMEGIFGLLIRLVICISISSCFFVIGTFRIRESKKSINLLKQMIKR